MINIPQYKEYAGETKLALMDNSTIAFLEQIERAGVTANKLLTGYDAVLIPDWVSEEISDSIYRKNYVESLLDVGVPLYLIAEEDYANLVNGEEGNLYRIVLAAVSTLGAMKSYLRRYVEKTDPLDMEEYSIWIDEMYRNWPLTSAKAENGREKKKNAGEISLTILAEIFSWYYPAAESITVYTQDRDSFDYQKNAHRLLKEIFKNRNAIDVSFKSNDSLLCQMYRSGMITLDKVREVRKDERVVLYTRQREDKSIALASAKLDNAKFAELLYDSKAQVIF
jgi:hypothetical protein